MFYPDPQRFSFYSHFYTKSESFKFVLKFFLVSVSSSTKSSHVINSCHVIDCLTWSITIIDEPPYLLHVLMSFTAVEVMEKLSLSSTLKPLTNAHTVRGRPNLKDVERFRNGSNHLRGREHSSVKLLLNHAKPISNPLLSIYNSETTTSDESYVNYGCRKDQSCVSKFSEE